MTTVVVEQPDDLPVVGVSEHNPYKSHEDQLSVDQPRTIYFGDTLTTVPATVVFLASELENTGSTIRMVCAFDTVFSVINFIVSGNLVMLIPAFFSYMGYWGASRFNRVYIKLYIFFQTVNAGSKVFWLASRQTNDVDINTVVGISVVFNIVMIAMATKFVRMIPT